MLCALVIFPLIWMGGLVTTYDAGMAVPDWPNTYGYNLFLYPVRDWFFGPWDLFVEHGHRLLGSLAGVICIALVVTAVWKDQRKWFRWVAVLALLLVIVQGLLGGARVVMDERLLAKIHGCLGPAFFALVAGIVTMSSSWWFRVKSNCDDLSPTDSSPSWLGSSLPGLTVVLLVSSYLQLILGANLRHVTINSDPVGYQVLVGCHVALAIFIGVWSILICSIAQRKRNQLLGLSRMGWILALMVLIQILLGIATWIVKFGVPGILSPLMESETFTIEEKSFWQMNIITGHVAVGSLILATTACMTLRAWRVKWLVGNTELNKGL